MIAWGDNPPLCAMKCMQLAECELDGEPLCITCADEALERFALMSVKPELAQKLPALGYGAQREVRPVALPPRTPSGDSDELRQQRKAVDLLTTDERAYLERTKSKQSGGRSAPPPHRHREPSSAGGRGSQTKQPGSRERLQSSDQLCLLDE